MSKHPPPTVKLSERPPTTEGQDLLLPFFQTSPALLCIAGADGYFRRINPAVSKLLGYSEAELMERPIAEFIHPEDRALTATHRDRLLKGKPLVNFENRYLTKDGRTIWLSWHSIPCPDSTLVYAVAREITAAKAHEQERIRLLAELTTNNERIKQANYSTAHDIRSPLSGLISALELIDRSMIGDPETRETFEVVERAATNLRQMLDWYIEDLQERETNFIPCETLELKAVFATVTRSIDFLIRESNTRFELDFEAFDSLRFNRRFLESIFLNLITNAIKYAHPDREPRIRISGRKIDGVKQLVFADNGIGFDAVALKGRLFGLNQKFHNHAESKGVGLYLVRHHLNSLGGEIEVTSQVDQGTAFTLRFADTA